MPKRVLLVGHCGPDSTYLRMTVKAALGDVVILSADTSDHMQQELNRGVDLVLLNRELDYGFEPQTGMEMISVLKQKHPDIRMILISNYPDAQAAAQAAGAMPGFGKRELGSPKVKKLLQDAVVVSA